MISKCPTCLEAEAALAGVLKGCLSTLRFSPRYSARQVAALVAVASPEVASPSLKVVVEREVSQADLAEHQAVSISLDMGKRTKTTRVRHPIPMKVTRLKDRAADVEKVMKTADTANMQHRGGVPTPKRL